MKRINKEISLLLVAVMACLGCQPAYAEEVAVPDALPAVEATGPTAADLAGAMSAAGPVQTAMLVTVPTDPTADISTAGTSRLPVTAYAGTGQETRLGVDLSSINSQAEREGWPWYAWAGVIVGTVAIAGFAAWAIVEASHETSHDHDSSNHYTIYGDDGSTMNVHIGPETSTSTSSTKTSSYTSSTTTGW